MSDQAVHRWFTRLAALALALCGLTLPAATQTEPVATTQTFDFRNEPLGAALAKLISDPSIAVEWMDRNLAAEPVTRTFASGREAALRSILSELDFVAIYSAATPERSLKRLVIMGRGSAGPGAAVTAATLVGSQGGLKDLTPAETDAIAVEVSEYLARTEATIGWQANSNLAHVNQLERTAAADGGTEASLRYPNNSAGYPPLYRLLPVGDPHRDTATAQALTSQMAIRNLHALSRALGALEPR